MLAAAALLVCVWVIAESGRGLLLLTAATVGLTVPLYWFLIRPLWRSRNLAKAARSASSNVAG